MNRGNVMKINIKRYLTPYKYNKAIIEKSNVKGAYDSESVDCPFVFKHDGKFYMLHVGFDGRGYQTALKTSEDLINWKHECMIFSRNTSVSSWDSSGQAGLWILKNDNFEDIPTLKKYNGKYWMVYHSYPDEGYEEGPAQLGIAYTTDETLHDWKRLDKPILSYKDGNNWEKFGLYKGSVIENNGKFYLFYNAKNAENSWHEQIGLAVSDDLLNWTRFGNEPLISNSIGGWDSIFCADPYIVRDGEIWVMFYYGYNGKNAKEGIAFSEDLLRWEKFPHPILSNGSGDSLDNIHAHKPSVLKYKGNMYHFYCAVGTKKIRNGSEQTFIENRCITFATSKPVQDANI